MAEYMYTKKKKKKSRLIKIKGYFMQGSAIGSDA